MTLIHTRHKDVDYSEIEHLEHMTPAAPYDQRAKLWNEGIRGRETIIVAETFKAGDCPLCDSWKYADSNFYIIRARLELGD